MYNTKTFIPIRISFVNLQPSFVVASLSAPRDDFPSLLVALTRTLYCVLNSKSVIVYTAVEELMPPDDDAVVQALLPVLLYCTLYLVIWSHPLPVLLIGCRIIIHEEQS